MPEKLFGRTLVIRGGALGDFLLTLPVVAALRGASAHLELLANPQCADLAREAGLVHAGRSIEYGPLAGFFARGAVHDPELRAYFSSFDLIVSYLYDPDRIFEENLRAAGAKRFVAGPHKPGPHAHAVDQMAGPLAELNLRLGERAVEIRIPGVSPQSGLVSIHPGSGSLGKNWAAENWRLLAHRLLSDHPQIRLAVAGGESDTAALEGMGGIRSSERVAIWKNLPLVALARNLASARAYLGHDTGVSHLAAILGVPSLVIFGPTDPAVWAPPHSHVQVLRAPEGNLSRLDLGGVLAAVGKRLAPRLLACDQGSQQNHHDESAASCCS